MISKSEAREMAADQVARRFRDGDVRVNIVRPDITRPVIEAMERDAGSFTAAVQDALGAAEDRQRQETNAQLFGEVRVVDPNTGGAKGQKLARFDLMPWDALTELAKHYGKGALKYPDPPRNWELGYAWSLNFAALQRHLTEWWAGEERVLVHTDPETGEEFWSHPLDAVMWHSAALRAFALRGIGTDDRPKS